MKFTPTLLLILGCTVSCLTQTVYVAPNGTGDGSSWASARGDLRTALLTAGAGAEVWVAAGVYHPVSCAPCDSLDRTLSFVLPNQVAVYGGFIGNETTRDQRDWQNQATVLSGDLDNDGTRANNAFTVVYTNNVTESAILDGFYIRDGAATDTLSFIDGRNASGGGWYNDGGVAPTFAYPTVRNVVFENNYAVRRGGAWYNKANFGGNAQPHLENVRFHANRAGQKGGAWYCDGSFDGLSKPVFTDCIFTSNQAEADSGGAIYNDGSQGGNASGVFHGGRFEGNVAATEGGAVENVGLSGVASPDFYGTTFVGNFAMQGGAIYNNGFINGISNPTFDSVRFEANHALLDGGAVFNAGFQGQASPHFTACLFLENTSGGAGAGVFSNGIEGVSNPVLNHCWFEGNVTQTYGAGMYNNGKNGECSPVLNNCVFYKNTAVSSAGAIYNLGSEGGNSSPVLTNCTIYGNWAVVGGAIYNNANDDNGNASALVRNCIIYHNVSPNGNVFRNIHGTPTIEYSLVDTTDCAATNAGFGGFTTCGEGMLFDLDPSFVDAENGDLRLVVHSPAVNVGSTLAVNEAGILVDIYGKNRVQGIAVDLGAAEFEDAAVYTPPLITQQPQPQSVCPGESTTFSVTVQHNDPVDYQWQRDETDLTGATAATLTLDPVSSADAGSYRVRITGSAGDVQFSDAVALGVSAVVTPEVSIAANTLEVCTGEPIQFSSIFTGSGAEPQFQWSINGNDFGGSIPAFSIDNLNDGDQIQLTATSSLGCVTTATVSSNILTVHIMPTVEPMVEITAQQGAPDCPGTPLGFVATPTHGGSAPGYVWYVNGTAQGVDAAQFSSTTLSDGDAIYAELTSDLACATVATVRSDTFFVGILPALTPAAALVAESDTAICPGASVFFSLDLANAGDAPAFAWYVDDVAQNTDAPTFEATDLQGGETVYAALFSNAPCATSDSVRTELFTVAVKDCSSPSAVRDLPLAVDAVFPNPVRDVLTVRTDASFRPERFALVNAAGRTVLEGDFPVSGSLSVTALPPGWYTLRLFAATRIGVARVVVLR